MASAEGFVYLLNVSLTIFFVASLTRRSIARSFLLAFLLALAGCSAFKSDPMTTLLERITHQNEAHERTQFDPQYHFLRIVVSGSVVFLASETPDIDAANATSVWYSAGREVLRFRDGRLVGTAGMVTDWRGVVLPELPAWSELASSTVPLKWTRIRDVMPGYHFGVRDTLILQRIPAPQDSHLKGIQPDALIWFEEQLQRETNPAGRAVDLPSARYAVDTHRARGAVVYGEQCVSKELCFSWQRWPLDAEGAK